MIAAIYARKSTEQVGVADEQKSVARQIEHARAFATSKGWTVDPVHVYEDDGISGAEFERRPAFLRLMNALKTRGSSTPGFSVLIMSEESRLGREAIETAYALKQIIQSGVKVWFYMEGRERTLETPTDKLLMSVTAFADELEREKARQRTYDAMQRKARAGHVTGGRVFGYDNIDVVGPDGYRSHVERRINPSEAAIVVRIFELCASGTGYTRIAKHLNAEGAPCPRPQQARPAGWSPSTVNEVLHRELYRGVLLWNRSRKRDRWGRQRQHARGTAEWMRREAPELRIVSEAAWSAAHGRLAGIRAHLEKVSGGKFGRRSRDVDSKYLLPGFARCGVCGGCISVTSRDHGKRRVMYYACLAHHKRGGAVCSNGRLVRMEPIDRAVLAALGDTILRPEIVDAVVAGVFAELRRESLPATHERLGRELQTVETELQRLAIAIAEGGQMGALLEALKARQARRDDLRAQIAAAAPMPAMSRQAAERAVRARLADWRGLLTTQVQDGRELLRRTLAGPLKVTPAEKGFRFEGEAALGRLLDGVAPCLASPAGTGHILRPEFRMFLPAA